jgi:hypothetical protein
VNARNGRRFDTVQNKVVVAHLGCNDSKKARTLPPSASSRQLIPRDSRNDR